jgi:hypothetical protein
MPLGNEQVANRTNDAASFTPRKGNKPNWRLVERNVVRFATHEISLVGLPRNMERPLLGGWAATAIMPVREHGRCIMSWASGGNDLWLILGA